MREMRARKFRCTTCWDHDHSAHIGMLALTPGMPVCDSSHARSLENDIKKTPLNARADPAVIHIILRQFRQRSADVVVVARAIYIFIIFGVCVHEANVAFAC